LILGAPYIIPIYFIYGLAFFSMGLLVAIEGGRASDVRLRRALPPLAAFGLIHASTEWIGMYLFLDRPLTPTEMAIIQAIQLATLAFSFISLAAFGSFLLADTEVARRLLLLIPIGLAGIWVFGLYTFRGLYSGETLWDIAHVWTRYTLAMPAAILTAIGLIVQQRAFRRSGLVRFGQDALWAAIAFAWYGLFGQIFAEESPLTLSQYINEDEFQRIFGFPVQLFRAVMAVAAALFVIRFLRAFQVETDRKIAELQAARLEESQQRETLRVELFRRVVAAQEAERQRIARDLHDETGQSLTAIGMGLRGLSGKLGQRNKDALATLHKLEVLTADSLKELQRLMTDLRPSHLDDLGLSAALRWYASRIQEHSSLNIRVDIHGEERDLEDAVKITIFRIIQECLNNVIKHSQATHVNIHVHFEEQRVRINVFDNGIGFDPDQVQQRRNNRPSLGIAGMEERAALLGGTVNVQTRPGYGTEVQALIPYHHSGGSISDQLGVHFEEANK
jgi:signal transduction histidine kinase